MTINESFDPNPHWGQRPISKWAVAGVGLVGAAAAAAIVWLGMSAKYAFERNEARDQLQTKDSEISRLKDGVRAAESAASAVRVGIAEANRQRCKIGLERAIRADYPRWLGRSFKNVSVKSVHPTGDLVCTAEIDKVKTGSGNDLKVDYTIRYIPDGKSILACGCQMSQ